LFNQEVRALAFKPLVRLFLDNDNNVTWFHAGELISLAVENILGSVSSTFVHFSFDNFFLLDNFFAVASLAFIFFVDDLTLATAIVTRSLRLTVHPWTKHLHLGDLSSAFAGATLLNCTIFASLALALATDSFAVHSNFGWLSTVNFLQSYLQGVHYGLAFLRARWPTLAASSHAEHLAEDVIHAAASATSSFFKSLLADLIVEIALILVAENLISI
jgi:hypothetical protein